MADLVSSRTITMVEQVGKPLRAKTIQGCFDTLVPGDPGKQTSSGHLASAPPPEQPEKPQQGAMGENAPVLDDGESLRQLCAHLGGIPLLGGVKTSRTASSERCRSLS